MDTSLTYIVLNLGVSDCLCETPAYQHIRGSYINAIGWLTYISQDFIMKVKLFIMFMDTNQAFGRTWRSL